MTFIYILTILEYCKIKIETQGCLVCGIRLISLTVSDLRNGSWRHKL